MDQKMNLGNSFKQSIQNQENYSIYFPRDIGLMMESEQVQQSFSTNNLFRFLPPPLMPQVRYIPYHFNYSFCIPKVSGQNFHYFAPSMPFQPHYLSCFSDFQKTLAPTKNPDDDENPQNLRPTGTIVKLETKEEEWQMMIKQRQHLRPSQKITQKGHQNPQGNQFQSPHENEEVLGPETAKSISREDRVRRYLIKKQNRTYNKRIVYQCRKSVADNRLRVKGRFVKRVHSQEEGHLELTAKENQKNSLEQK